MAASRVHEMTPSSKLGPVFVQTDSQGSAKIYYQVGDIADAPQITASLVCASSISQTFRVTEESTGNTGRTASLEILSGDGQSATKGKYLDKPLIVIVRSPRGNRISDTIIQFRTITGTLELAPGTTAPTPTDDCPSKSWTAAYQYPQSYFRSADICQNQFQR